MGSWSAPDTPCRRDVDRDHRWQFRHAELAKTGELLVATHMPFPSVGPVALDGDTFSFRPFDFKRFKRFAERVQPGLRAIEKLSRPRWTIPHAVAGRLVGAVVFLLALSAIWPLPLVNVIPGAVIVLIAIAYLQRVGWVELMRNPS